MSRLPNLAKDGPARVLIMLDQPLVAEVVALTLNHGICETHIASGVDDPSRIPASVASGLTWDLPNVAPVEYMDFLLNNRQTQVPSFTACAHKCDGVFETLNMITRLLLHKFINESNRKAA